MPSFCRFIEIAEHPGQVFIQRKPDSASEFHRTELSPRPQDVDKPLRNPELRREFTVSYQALSLTC